MHTTPFPDFLSTKTAPSYRLQAKRKTSIMVAITAYNSIEAIIKNLKCKFAGAYGNEDVEAQEDMATAFLPGEQDYHLLSLPSKGSAAKTLTVSSPRVPSIFSLTALVFSDLKRTLTKR